MSFQFRTLFCPISYFHNNVYYNFYVLGNTVRCIGLHQYILQSSRMKVKTWLFVSWQYPKYKNGILVSFGRSCKIDISLSVYQIMKIKSFYKMVSRGERVGEWYRCTGRREEEGEGRLEHMLSLYLELTTHTQMLNTRTHLQWCWRHLEFSHPPLSSNLLSYVESNICGVGFLACGFMVWMVIGRCAHVDTVGARALVKAQIWLFSGQMKLTILIKQH